MEVSGLVSPGVGGREETQLPAPSVIPVLLLLLLHRPPLPRLLQTRNFMPPKDAHCCTAALIFVPLAWGMCKPYPPLGRGDRCFGLANKFYTGELCAPLLSPHRTPKSPSSSLSGQLLCMHLQPSEAFRSVLLFEPYTLIYSFWTLESLTGMCLPVGSVPTLYSKSKQPLSVSRLQTATSPAGALSCPQPRSPPAGQSLLAFPPLLPDALVGDPREECVLSLSRTAPPCVELAQASASAGMLYI